MSSIVKRTPSFVSGKGQAATRSGALIAVTQLWLHETGKGVPKFAEALAESYLQAVPEDLRKAPLKVPSAHGDADDYYLIQGSNLKAVQRYLDGTTPIPMDLEEVWCGVLPEQYRDQAIFALCARFGVLPIRIAGETDIHALAEMMRDEAAVIEAMAPIMADGEINEKDRPAAIEAIPRVKKAIASLAGILARLEEVTGERSLQVVGSEAGGSKS